MTSKIKFDENQYPRVLIISQNFNSTTGGGITLSALFRGWPRDKIALAYPIIDDETGEYCKTSYRLGYDEKKRLWPFNLNQKRIESGPVFLDANVNKNVSPGNFSDGKQEMKPVFNIVYQLIRRSGFYPFIYRQNVSPKFLKWVDDYNPDIVYTQLSSIDSIKFVTQLVEKTSLPLAIHIMDDWPKTISEPGLLHFYWKNFINRKFKKLLQYSSVLMSICQAMSDEYFQRYKIKSIPFHNTIDIDKWFKKAKSNWEYKKPFTVLYAGRIGRGTSKSLLTTAHAVEKLGSNGLKINFQLQTKDLPHDFEEAISSLKYTIRNEFISYDELPQKFSSVDLLILPMDFDQFNLDFIRLSMPTKVPEYLASGTPVLVFASKDTALAKYAHDAGWGYVVLENSIDILAGAIQSLYENKDLRERLGMTGKRITLENHDGRKVRIEFRDELSNAVR